MEKVFFSDTKNLRTVGKHNLYWKKSLLVIQKHLGLLFNTLTTGEKYSSVNRDNLMQQMPMHISKKQKKV